MAYTKTLSLDCCVENHADVLRVLGNWIADLHEQDKSLSLQHFRDVKVD